MNSQKTSRAPATPWIVGHGKTEKLDARHALACAELALGKLLEIKRNAVAADLRAQFEATLQLIKTTIAGLEADNG